MSKILLVEDDLFLSSLLANRLKKENFEVVPVKDGNDAIKSLGESRPDVMLLDIILPGKSGFEILEFMKSQPKLEGLPVIVISNLGQENDIERAKSLGAIDYFIKARTSIDDLVKKVKSYIK